MCIYVCACVCACMYVCMYKQDIVCRHTCVQARVKVCVY